MKKLELRMETMKALNAQEAELAQGGGERYSYQIDCPSHIATCGDGTRCKTGWFQC